MKTPSNALYEACSVLSFVGGSVLLVVSVSCGFPDVVPFGVIGVVFGIIGLFQSVIGY